VSEHHVQSLARGLAVIRAFGPDAAELTLSDVARRTDLTRAAARRFLLTLVDLGYVRSDGKQFALTPRVLELGYAYLSGQTLPEIATPHLEALSAEVGESCSVSVLDGADIVYVARYEASRIMSVRIAVGTRFPAYPTSMGRVLLADLPQPELDAILAALPDTGPTPKTTTSEADLRAALAAVSAQGWALVDQELEVGLRAIAAPIRDRTGRAVAAANISTQAGRTTLDQARRVLLPRLLDACRAIETDLSR
jgi:IclR family pca regulon transcriptional regulator